MINLKAVILAAGKGERLGDVTKVIPKPMIKVLGKPMLEHNILLCKDSGINEIYINLHHLPQVIKKYFCNGSKWDVKIRYNYEPKLLGTAGAIKNLSKYLYDSPFIVIYGDNYLNFDLLQLLNFHREKKSDFSMLLFWLDDISESGVAELDSDSKIIRFEEKPVSAGEYSHWVNAGIYIIEPKILKELKKGYLDFSYDVIPLLIDCGYKVYGYKMKNKVIAIDSPKLLNNIKLNLRG